MQLTLHATRATAHTARRACFEKGNVLGCPAGENPTCSVLGS